MAGNQEIIETLVSENPKTKPGLNGEAKKAQMILQTTIRNQLTISGVGLHTGANVSLTFLAAPENTGYRFRRIDLPGQPVIEADVDNVVDTDRGTTIGKNGARVSTIEHVLAA